jgi:hypothetical protein
MSEDCAVHAESTQSDGGHFYVIFLVAAQGPAFHSRYGNILSCLDFRAPSGDRENAGERRPRLAGKKDDLCFGGEDLKFPCLHFLSEGGYGPHGSVLPFEMAFHDH